MAIVLIFVVFIKRKIVANVMPIVLSFMPILIIFYVQSLESLWTKAGQHIRVMESLHLTCDPYQEDSDLNVMLLSDRCCLRYASREIPIYICIHKYVYAYVFI